MHTQSDRFAPRIRRLAAASAGVWVTVVAATFWYLRRAQPAGFRALPLTHADSLGLPLLAVALLAAGVLVVANGVAAAVLLLRRRRHGRTAAAPSRRAV